MANSEIDLIQSGLARDGNNPSVVQGIRAGVQTCGAITPTLWWVCPITHETLGGEAGTQTTTFTIPAITSGRVDVAFSGTLNDGTVVDVTVSAVFDTDAGTTAAALEAAIEAARSTSLAGIVADESVDTADITIDFEPGIGLVEVEVTHYPAQVFEIDWDPDTVGYAPPVGVVNVTISGGALGSAVSTNVSLISAADTDAVAAATESALEGLIATTLADVLVSADDTGAVNELVFEPGIVGDDDYAVTISGLEALTIALGTYADGTTTLSIDHASLAVPVIVSHTASTSDNDTVGGAIETAIEAHPQLAALISSANYASNAVTVICFPGVEDLTVDVLVETGSPITVTPSRATVTETTGAGDTITVAHSVTLDLNTIYPFPGITDDGGEPVNREWVMLYVSEAFGSGRTITVGDAANPDAVLGSTPITLNSTGHTGSSSSDAEYLPRPEGNWVPTATIALGASVALTAGACAIRVLYSPEPAVPTAA